MDDSRDTHGEQSSIFEHASLGRIEIRDPIRGFWKSCLKERLGTPLAGQQRTQVDGREMEFVPFELGMIFLDVQTSQIYEVSDQMSSILEHLKSNLGQWSRPFDEGSVGIHAALLHTNEVLFFTYDSELPGLPHVQPPEHHNHHRMDMHVHFPMPWGEWSLLDLKTGRHVVRRQRMYRNLFCGGQCLLGDGQLLVVGGERDYDRDLPELLEELKDLGPLASQNQYNVFLYIPGLRAWSALRDLTTPRWYPTVVTSGWRVGIAVGGDYRAYTYDLNHPPPGVANPTAEFVDADGPRANPPLHFGPDFTVPVEYTYPDNVKGTTSQYPFVFVLPRDGRTLIHFRKTSYILPPGSFDFSKAEILPEEDRPRTTGFYGTAVMLPLRPTDNPPYKARIMMFGGHWEGEEKKGSCSILDTEVVPLQWNLVEPASDDREFCDSVLLPDGTVLLVNGCQKTKKNPVHRPQIYDPETKTWSVPLARAQAIRLYHSTALLLPDGTVLTAGTDRLLNEEFVPHDMRELEVFAPPYLFAGPRPRNLWTPSEIGYDLTFEVAVSDASEVASVCLIRNGSVTHSFNSDQRFIELQIVERLPMRAWLVGPRSNQPYGFFYAQGLKLRAPPTPLVAPYGYYMLFLVSAQGVPSVAVFVQCVPRQSFWILTQRAVLNVLGRAIGALLPKTLA